MRCAVITGDLIGSTTSTPEAVSDTMELLQTRSNQIGPDTRFTRHRGDGWQILLSEPGIGLRVIVSLAADLASAGWLQSRMALGIGQAGTVPERTLETASGTAFVASGRTLDALPAGRRMDMSGDGVDGFHRCLIAYIDRQVQDWSIEQAEAVSHMITLEQTPAQVVIAARLGISRQAFAARLAAAGFSQLDAATNAFFDTFGNVGATHA